MARTPGAFETVRVVYDVPELDVVRDVETLEGYGDFERVGARRVGVKGVRLEGSGRHSELCRVGQENGGKSKVLTWLYVHPEVGTTSRFKTATSTAL